MKKISILFIAAIAMISCGNTYNVKVVELTNKADSLNYAYGCGYGNYIVQAALQGEATPAVINEFISAIEDGYNDKVPTLSQVESVGMNVGQSVKSFEKKGLMNISAWRLNEKLLFQGLINGLNQDTAIITRDPAMTFINEQMRNARELEEVDVEKAIKGKLSNKVAKVALNTFNDSINYIFGYINGEDIFAGLIAQDSDVVAATKEFIESVNKGLKCNYENPSLVNDGHMMGKQFKTSEEEGFMGMASVPFNYEILLQGLINGLNQDTVMMNGDFATTYLQATMQEVQAEAAKAENEEHMAKEAAFLAENAQRPEVTVTESGLQYEVIKMGKGAKPAATDRVRVHYHGTLLDGTVFDSSVDRGEPITFGLNQVIPGWTEGVQLMPVGSKFKFYIPQELGYGERQAGSIPPFSMLIFEVELLDIEK